MKSTWDVIVIGAGMSGLGAGIRLALAGKKVLIVEQHNTIGGLNGFYQKNGIPYDVGLHALTNFAPYGTKGCPLSKLCRQLRIPYENLQLQEQRNSKIQFPDIAINFNNRFDFFLEEIRKNFPKEIDNMQRLDSLIEAFQDTALEGPNFISSRERLNTYISNPLLREMLLLPLFYYGSAHVNDLDWRQFAILYKAIYKEGFSRPCGGVRTVLKLLLDRYHTYGGVLKTKSKVKSIQINNNHADGLILDNDEYVQAKQILSSIGYFETQTLCGEIKEISYPILTFTETITTYLETPQALGWTDTVTFFNHSEKIDYSPPNNFIDLRSGVVCIPENYGPEIPQRTTLRTTHLSNYAFWEALSPEIYNRQKQNCLQASLDCAFKILKSQPSQSPIAFDIFTPLTIERFTKHHHGAVYGSPKKYRNGYIGYENLFICGTDQGFLGIIGAILSGISIANLHCLKDLS